MGIQVRTQEEKSQTSVPAPNPPKFKAVYPAASYMYLIVRLSLRGWGGGLYSGLPDLATKIQDALLNLIFG